MSNWIHRLFNPHCEHCKEERDDSRICPSCETLKQQLEIANFEREKLLARILEKPAPEPERKFSTDEKIAVPHTVPWNVRRQMLEREDRERARLMRDAPQPISTAELEKDLDIAAAAREEAKG